MPKRNVFFHLFAAMVAFGLLIGLIFPFLAKSILHNEKALSMQFIALCLGAGMVVGLANYMLFHLVISNELDRIITGMKKINANIQKNLFKQVHTETPCEIEVTSNDRLGEVSLAFNIMGKTIDERQRWERMLREVMNALSDSVDLDHIGRIILNHIPATPNWNHALLYVVIDEKFQCIGTKNINISSVAQTLKFQDLNPKKTLSPEEFHTLDIQETCFSSLELLIADHLAHPSHITLFPLSGDETCIGIVVTACNKFTPLSADEKQLCQTYYNHIQPYLRNALLHKKIEKLATVDELSQVLNRRAGMLRLQEEFSSAQRHKTPLSLIMLDIDHFKNINDTHGHQTGDNVISELCSRLQENIRDEDTVFRYGGEEFIVILPKNDLTEAALCAERLRLLIGERSFASTQDGLQVRISLGVASWPQKETSTPEILIRHADQALYWAKEKGRDQVAVQTDSKILSFTQNLGKLKEFTQ